MKLSVPFIMCAGRKKALIRECFFPRSINLSLPSTDTKTADITGQFTVIFCSPLKYKEINITMIMNKYI